MKVAVLSDVHGNLPALEAVSEHIERWAPDRVIMNGDVVNRGPSSVACWDFVQEHCDRDGWVLAGGNHEAYVANWEREKPRDQARLRTNIDQSARWTYEELDGRIGDLLSLPACLEVTAPDGSVLRVTHGSMQGQRDGIYPHTPERELAEKVTPSPAVFCTAHTHKPLLRRWRRTLIVNSGSAGTSFDGDPRISYAQVVWCKGQWQAEIVRLPYDRRRAARDFEEEGYLEGGGPLVEIFYTEWRQARPLINRWAREYEEAVLAEEISVAASVREFLAEHG
ncbi:MAG TPA: metallophosphoesterase family protein [Candidatus Sulfomarinibacteraceae bacterium]|nr:metallophosphoesterase family protein [Candidatus Sulfomarinibacteraceae bacterium]